MRALGTTPIAYCSGYDNPVALKALAAQWNVRLCVDVEGGGLRPDGSWKQAFINASGAGIYGNYWVHPGVNAPFHIVCAFLGAGDPRATWWSGTPRPAGPCGYQYQGTHSEFGVSVDSTWLDDWFAGLSGGGGGSLEGEDLTPDQDSVLRQIFNIVKFGLATGGDPGSEGFEMLALKPELDTIKTGVAALEAHLAPTIDATGSNPSPLDTSLSSIQNQLTTIGTQMTTIGTQIANLPAPSGGGSVDTKPVLDAIAALKLELDTVGGDVATVKRRVEKDLAP